MHKCLKVRSHAETPNAKSLLYCCYNTEVKGQRVSHCLLDSTAMQKMLWNHIQLLSNSSLIVSKKWALEYTFLMCTALLTFFTPSLGRWRESTVEKDGCRVCWQMPLPLPRILLAHLLRTAMRQACLLWTHTGMRWPGRGRLEMLARASP